MDRKTKEIIVSNLCNKIKDAKITIITDFKGLNVQEMTQLRKELKRKHIEYHVIKNSLIKLALKEKYTFDINSLISGQNAIALGLKDPIELAKILTKFTNTQPKMIIKSGILEGKIITANDIKELAELPPKEVLIGKIVWVMRSSLLNTMNVLRGPHRKLIYALNEVKQKLGNI